MTYSICYCCLAVLLTLLLSYKDAKHSETSQNSGYGMFNALPG